MTENRSKGNGRYSTTIFYQNTSLIFTAPTPGETYGQSLLHILKND